MKKYLGNRPSKKSHFIRVSPSDLHFYGYFKNGKMNFFSKFIIRQYSFSAIDLAKTIFYDRLKN